MTTAFLIKSTGDVELRDVGELPPSIKLMRVIPHRERTFGENPTNTVPTQEIRLLRHVLMDPKGEHGDISVYWPEGWPDHWGMNEFQMHLVGMKENLYFLGSYRLKNDD